MNRFHNKYHRHNHHTDPSPNDPDSSHDPIASPEDPFKGDFHILGQISAKSTVFEKLSVQGDSYFKGNVFVDSPITNILERLTIVPKSSTNSFYFKIVDDFANYPLAEFYQLSRPIFYISTAGNVGINTNTPAVQLDVNGNVRFHSLTADKGLYNGEVTLLSSLTVSGTSLFNNFTAVNNSRIGYLDIGYVPDNHAYLKTFDGNKDLQIRANNELNATFHPSSISILHGKVGLNYDPPTENLTINAPHGVGFRTNGFVFVDSTQANTLRIITNREDADDYQHHFSFTYDGRYVVGDINYDHKYDCDYAKPGTPIAQNTNHKIAVFTKDEFGNALSLTNTASAEDFTGPNLRFYRTDGDATNYISTKRDQHLGGIEAYGYNTDICFTTKNASIEFYAANDYTTTERGGYTVFKNVCADGASPIERVRFDHNGFVGINTVAAPSGRIIASTLSAVSGRPNVMFEVFDYPYSTDPVSVVTAGVSSSVMTQIIGGSQITDQVAIRLSDRGTDADNFNHIEFTHGSKDIPIVRYGSTNRDANAASGGSLLLATTYLSSVLPFERARITHEGDLGVGISTPHSRAHIHDDNKLVGKGSGTNRDIVTISTNNNTCGFLLSSESLSSRVYNNNSTKELHITTCTSGGMIKLDVATETPAVVITSAGNVGINIDERLDSFTRNHTLVANHGVSSEIKLGVNGDTMLFNSINAPSIGGGGARLYFNKDVANTNQDPIFIHRYNIDTEQSHLRVNIGDETCTPGNNQYDNPGNKNDIFSIGNYSNTLVDWTPWLDVGPCFTRMYNNVKINGDVDTDGDTTIRSTLSVMGSARFDENVNIKGTLSVYNCGIDPKGVPLKVTGNTFIDGDLFVTGNITGFWPNPGATFWRPIDACTPSDIRLKTNIIQLTGSLDKIDQIRGVYFDWDEELQPMYKGHDVGVIAQEIEQVLPEVVNNTGSYKGVNYEKIVPLLIECIKELKAEIQLLKNK